ncbi:MAG: HdaA/DnaA family protein [Hyphomicrobiales bacterium]
MTREEGDRAGAAQLTLELPHDVALGAEDFFISGSNEHAYGLIEAWPDWPKRALVLSGPPGSGKTHLASIWQGRSGARTIASNDLIADIVPQLAGHSAIVIEDGPGAALDETALFHLLNLVGERDLALLITTTAYPAAWTVALPDLASRLRALPVVELNAPDEPLLRAVLVKLFADRQLAIDETVIAYMVARMERSIAAARRLVDLVDRAALAEQVSITRPFVARIMRDRGLV